MSLENKKTLDSYQKKAFKYLENNKKLDINEVKKSNKKLHKFIKENLSNIPKGKILEIGSADGEIAKYIKELGYDITSSDIADDFIKELKQKGLNPIKLNILEDKIKEKYSTILCWKVFVHFTDEDVLKALNNTYDALEKNGILIFNVISRETRSVKEEWIDFPGEYSLGINRYFRYYYKEELDKIIKQTKYKILSFHEEIGIEKSKWLVYVLKKGE